MPPATVQSRYPRLADFAALRRELDPDDVFGNQSKTYTTTDFGGPIVYRSLAIEFQETANNINYFAFTDIQFGEEVAPEPASASLLAAATLLALSRRNRTSTIKR